jgi:hypothetical protein
MVYKRSCNVLILKINQLIVSPGCPKVKFSKVGCLPYSPFISQSAVELFSFVSIDSLEKLACR